LARSSRTPGTEEPAREGLKLKMRWPQERQQNM
jgi:hypothetical protein